MQVQVSTVGLGIEHDPAAQSYLQQTAQIGGGGYFTASDTGQLSAALGAAASGQTGTAAMSPDQVLITSPRDGDQVGPSTVVEGRTGPNEIVVIYTLCFNEDTGEQIRKVPGIRHKATESGDFSFRIATPRVSFGDRSAKVRFEIHAHIVRAGGFQGPETVVTVYEQP
jgi:hypothetical protein